MQIAEYLFTRYISLLLIGLRGVMRAGNANMNDLTVIQASQVRQNAAGQPSSGPFAESSHWRGVLLLPFSTVGFISLL
jgi:hypothetical protein